MFINESKFKNLCKMAYKSGTLTVEHTEDDVINVKGRYWELQVFDIKDVTNKVLAAMAEFIGQLPRRGKICIYQGGEDKQIMDIEAAPKLLLEEAAEPEEYAQPTHLTIHLSSTTARIYQTESRKEPVLVPVLVHEMIDWKKCEDMEEYPGNPALHKSGDLIWSNDVMAFALKNIQVSLVGERDFLRLINGRDMVWDEKDYIQG